VIQILPSGLRGATITVNRGVERALNELGGVRSPELRAAGNALARSIRKTLSVAGGGSLAASLKGKRLHAVGGQPSAPGQPPHKQTGQLAKSVKAGPSGDAIKVGPLAFTSLFLEEGVNATKGDRRTSRGRGSRKRTTVKQRTLVIAARPFMARSLEAAKDKMVDVFVTEGRKHLERA
jgi:hypothetical protein